MMKGMRARYGLVFLVACHTKAPPPKPIDVAASPPRPGVLLTGTEALGDWTTDAPGVRRKLTLADLPPPHATKSVTNRPHEVERPAGASLSAPPGWKVDVFAAKLDNPRQARVAPNGDLFVAESEANRLHVLRDADGDGKPEVDAVFADGLKKPFGIAFFPPKAPRWIYVANTDSIVRFAYAPGDVKASGKPEMVYDKVSSGGHLTGGGHWTRDIVFDREGTKLFLSIGSLSNNDDDEKEARRARIFELSPDGKTERVYADGIRNAVGLAIHPDTGALWASVNERDELGDHLVPDYVTSVKDGGFYGWPWRYLGDHEDPKYKGKHPELAGKVTVPDVLLQSHSASLGMTFYSGKLDAQYTGWAFAAEHGSWNRERRTGYKVIAVPLAGGNATGEYVDFMTGFVTPDGNVWGRPVSVAEAKDGALFVTDDVGNCVWRVHR